MSANENALRCANSIERTATAGTLFNSNGEAADHIRRLVAENEALRAATRAQPTEVERWLPIETAPKERAIMLWLPEMGGWAAGPWRGCWSWALEQWAFHAPLNLPDGRAVYLTDLPHPTHWQPFPWPPAPAHSTKENDR